jgi:protein TonB
MRRLNKVALTASLVSFALTATSITAGSCLENAQTTSSKSTVKSRYFDEMHKKIKENWHPAEGLEAARVVVKYKVTKDGYVTNVRVWQSCGKTDADEAALHAVEDASPFGPLPAGLEDGADMQFKFEPDKSAASTQSSESTKAK